jgi:hypothetical protein
LSDRVVINCIETTRYDLGPAAADQLIRLVKGVDDDDFAARKEK